MFQEAAGTSAATAQLKGINVSEQKTWWQLEEVGNFNQINQLLDNCIAPLHNCAHGTWHMVTMKIGVFGNMANRPVSF